MKKYYWTWQGGLIMKKKTKLLISAHCFKCLKPALSRYFCDEYFEIKERYINYWVIYKQTRDCPDYPICLEHYQIIKKNNRLRFEEIL